MRHLLLFGTIFLLAAGQVLFKFASKSAPPGNPWGFLADPIFGAALVVYAIATVAWMLVLREWPLAIVYPAVALAIVLVLGAGVLFFGETLSLRQIVGAGTIVVGLIILGFG